MDDTVGPLDVHKAAHHLSGDRGALGCGTGKSLAEAGARVATDVPGPGSGGAADPQLASALKLLTPGLQVGAAAAHGAGCRGGGRAGAWRARRVALGARPLGRE